MMNNNMNTGYQGYSRSVRSAHAIESYELPLSCINKGMIESFLKENADLFDVKKLIVVPVNTWKFVASTFVEATSWHHTSSRLNKTDHYDLDEVASTIEKLGLDFINERMAEKKAEKLQKDGLVYAVLDAQIWGGSRNRPKLLGEEHLAGIQKGDWFYPVAYTDDYPLNQKYNVNARKVTLHRTFESYADLVKAYPEFKKNLKWFNRKIKILKGVKS
jgi:hypothetical protein